jgi:hypothetical protein
LSYKSLDINKRRTAAGKKTKAPKQRKDDALSRAEDERIGNN